MNFLGLWMTWTNSGHELKALDVINNLGKWMTWMTLGHELSPLHFRPTKGYGLHEKL